MKFPVGQQRSSTSQIADCRNPTVQLGYVQPNRPSPATNRAHAMMEPPAVPSRMKLLVSLIIGIIFIVDLNLPLGLAGGVPYVAAVLASLSAPGQRFTLWVTGICSALTIAGHFLSPAGADQWLDVVNRVLALFAIWVTAILSLKRKRAEEARARMEQITASRERLALLGELSAGVAHEFRNPLDGVLNCIQLLRPKLAQDPADAELLEMAEEGLRRMDGISARMLRLGREESHSRIATRIPELLDATLRMIALRAQKQQVALKTRVDKHLPQVEMDAEKISEALLNLLSNALDACSEGGSIIIGAAVEPGDASQVSMVVSDNGPGIPTGIRKQVFEPFFTTKPVGKGSGLGLAISRKIVESHGGRLELLDTEKGASFRITLPVKHAAEAPEGVPA